MVASYLQTGKDCCAHVHRFGDRKQTEDTVTYDDWHCQQAGSLSWAIITSYFHIQNFLGQMHRQIPHTEQSGSVCTPYTSFLVLEFAIPVWS